jgi:hypothetical protein
MDVATGQYEPVACSVARRLGGWVEAYVVGKKATGGPERNADKKIR